MATAAAERAVARCKDFVAWDVNEETRAQASDALKEALSSPSGPSQAFINAYGSNLEFGTAGLRGEMGPGFGRMNDLTVIQAAQGLVAHLEASLASSGASLEEAKAKGIVLGFDHRALGSLNSRRFAVLTAVAATSRGFKVFLMSRFTLTPLVPFTIVHKGAVAGVMVTASHNPKRDDGYKVYWGNGAQIVSPVDKGIAAAIALPENQKPWAENEALYRKGDEAALRASHSSLVVDLTDELVASYVAAVAADQCETKKHKTASFPVSIAYTAMHGVGKPFVLRMFEEFGLPAPHLTPEQVEADPEFPTVAFPNPEEGKGALALAMATAARAGSTLILANDPDADRLAVAEWCPANPSDAEPNKPSAAASSDQGEWRVFTGNEIGALLGSWCFERFLERGGKASDAVMVASTVSSKFLKAMAEKEGFSFIEVLTGFKFMGNEMARLDASSNGGKHGPRVIFSFEEAIGFACGTTVRDKDGVSAAAVMAELAHHLTRTASSSAAKVAPLSKRLASLYQRYGLHLTKNHYLFVDQPSKTDVIFARLRNEGHYWARLGDLAIKATRDLTGTGWDSEQADGKPVLPTSSGSHMLTFKFSNGVVATLRTSGTEPKLKYYCEIKGAVGQKEEDVRAELERTVELIMAEMLQPEKYGLKR